MKRLLIVAAVIGIPGCGKKEEPAAGTGSAPTPTGGKGMPTEADCDKIGAHTAQLSMGQTPPGTPPDRVARLKEISDEAGRAIATLCRTDGWSGEAVACGLASKDPARDCNDKLTETQKTKMQAQVMAIFAKAAPP